MIGGLSRPQKTLPCRFFYDARGSELFEEITRLPEYYPTRTETDILRAHAREMVERLPAGGVLIEFGSGSSLKTEILLDRLAATCRLCHDRRIADGAAGRAGAIDLGAPPRSTCAPIVGDFSRPVALPEDLQARPRWASSPAQPSAISPRAEAVRLLRIFRAALAPAGHLIIGADLKKDARRLVLAYNDAAGVTAAFNLNLLARINRELGGDFDLRASGTRRSTIRGTGASKCTWSA